LEAEINMNMKYGIYNVVIKMFQVMLAFYDPSQDLKFPGWPLRNLLILAAIKWHCRNIRIFCYREKKGLVDFDCCLVGDITLPGEC
jgi:ubiquitin-like modifier-activating enzyme ATG7